MAISSSSKFLFYWFFSDSPFSLMTPWTSWILEFQLIQPLASHCICTIHISLKPPVIQFLTIHPGHDDTFLSYILASPLIFLLLDNMRITNTEGSLSNTLTFTYHRKVGITALYRDNSYGMTKEPKNYFSKRIINTMKNEVLVEMGRPSPVW